MLSSIGELERATARPSVIELRPWALDVIAETDYDTSNYQTQLFVAPSFEAMLRDLESWLDDEIEGTLAGRGWR